MELTPYLDTLRGELVAAAAPGGPEMSKVAELLGGALEASARLALLEALSDAAAEITAKLIAASVEVRLHGREADLVVSQEDVMPVANQPPVAPVDLTGELARITLRLPESLKERIEAGAAAENISVNAWLVRALTAAVAPTSAGGPAAPSAGPQPAGQRGKRITGFARS